MPRTARFPHPLAASAVLAVLLVPGGAAVAQTAPEAALDRDQLLIGQQAQLTLSVTYRVDQGNANTIGWPAIGDTLTAYVEVVKDSGVDTILPDKAGDPYLFKQVRTLSITSWDSGYWAIPPFRFAVNGDTVETKALLLTVNTVQVDTAGALKFGLMVSCVPSPAGTAVMSRSALAACADVGTVEPGSTRITAAVAGAALAFSRASSAVSTRLVSLGLAGAR